MNQKINKISRIVFDGRIDNFNLPSKTILLILLILLLLFLFDAIHDFASS